MKSVRLGEWSWEYGDEVEQRAGQRAEPLMGVEAEEEGCADGWGQWAGLVPRGGCGRGEGRWSCREEGVRGRWWEEQEEGGQVERTSALLAAPSAYPCGDIRVCCHYYRTLHPSLFPSWTLCLKFITLAYMHITLTS